MTLLHPIITPGSDVPLGICMPFMDEIRRESGGFMLQTLTKADAVQL